jgi:hypothetical protein
MPKNTPLQKADAPPKFKHSAPAQGQVQKPPQGKRDPRAGGRGPRQAPPNPAYGR